MYNIIEIMFRDRSTIRRSYTFLLDEREAILIAEKWARSLQKEADGWEKEPVQIFYGYVDYHDDLKRMKGRILVND